VKIGVGGSKVVYRGLWTKENSTSNNKSSSNTGGAGVVVSVAYGRLKEMDDDEARASFLTELRTAWAMLHPHLVEVYALAADDVATYTTAGQLYTVAEPLHCSLYDAIHNTNSNNSSNSKIGGGNSKSGGKGAEAEADTEKSFLLSVPDHSVAARAFASLTYSQKLRLMVGLASAVAFLHEHKIIHRDINSSNILVGSSCCDLSMLVLCCLCTPDNCS